MKKYFILLSILLILPSILAVNLEVTKQSSDEVMILGLNNPAVFDLDIKNNGMTDNFMIYTFFGSGYTPTESFNIDSGEIDNIQFKVSPPYSISRTGFTNFNYFIQGSDNSEYTGELLVKVVELEDAFEVGAGAIDPESSSLEIYIKNKVNFDFGNLKVDFSSAFFDFDKEFVLLPNEKKTFQITLDKEDFKQLTAGFYTLDAQVEMTNKTANIKGIIDFAEKNLITTTNEKYGFIIRTNVITKSNDGNTAEIASVSVDKGTISRLFTSFSPQPDDISRDGSKVSYSWNEELSPGEVLEVKVKTNWFLPLLFILLIVGVVVFVKEYVKTNLRLRKKITFVKSKGGEFALKISLLVHAKKALDNVLIIERIPPLVKLFPKFGKEQPVRIDDKTKKAEWEFKRLEAGERRMITYVVYSKVGVLGRFALPRTKAIYEKEGKMQKNVSNKVFFLTEQVGK